MTTTTSTPKQTPTQAFTFPIGGGLIDEPGVVQQNPGWLIVVVPFGVEDSYNRLGAGRVTTSEAIRTNEIVMIESDCTALNVSQPKASPFGSLSATLKSGNYNYLSAIFPGDYVFVWMHNDANKIAEIAQLVRDHKPANSFDSGFKFFGRITAIREELKVVSPFGTKALEYQLTASSFTEFNSQVYAVPWLGQDLSYGFMQKLGKIWAEQVGANRTGNVQDLVKMFINVFIGCGPQPLLSIKSVESTPNAAFLVPKVVGQLLGRIDGEAKAGGNLKYTDILTVILGIQNYAASRAESAFGAMPKWLNFGAGAIIPSYQGFMPFLNAPKNPKSKTGVSLYRQLQTSRYCEGQNFTFSQQWSNATVWSILKPYTNDIINEIYTTIRVDTDGSLVPQFIMRQIPFTTPSFAKQNPKTSVTEFMSLPRWKPDPAIVLSHSIGRTDVARVNFVAVWGDQAGMQDPSIWNLQFNKGNTVGDRNDILRSGLRPFIKSSSSDFPTNSDLDSPVQTGEATMVPKWSRIIADWVINGHLKMNGQVSMVGVSEPICVGDNFEWNGIVFHIEQVDHVGQIAQNGVLQFRTSVALSNGLDSSSGDIVQYAEMDSPYRENLEEKDEGRDHILPGYTNVEGLDQSIKRVAAKQNAVGPRPVSLPSIPSHPTLPTKPTVPVIPAPPVPPDPAIKAKKELANLKLSKDKAIATVAKIKAKLKRLAIKVGL